MSDLGIGKLIDGKQERDAIHIAVAPVVASVWLSPGQPIAFVPGSTSDVVSSATPIGIVDPFMLDRVFPKQQFWMFLLPNTITSLRHDWMHPAFLNDIPEAEKRLREFAARFGLTYERLLEGATAYLEWGNHLEDLPRLDSDDLAAFWNHFVVATGRQVLEGERGQFFGCPC